MKRETNLLAELARKDAALTEARHDALALRCGDLESECMRGKIIATLSSALAAPNGGGHDEDVREAREVSALSSLILEAWRANSVEPLNRIVFIAADGFPSLDFSKLTAK